MDSCNAPETQERKQPWEVRHEVRSLGSLRVDGVDGHTLPFRRLGELALMMEAHWDTQKTDWTAVVTSRKEPKEADEESRDLCGGG